MVLSPEDIAYMARRFTVPAPKSRLNELYSGEGLVAWHGTIERQVDKMKATYDSARNSQYSDKLTAFLNIWRNNPISGSINIETVDILLAATEVLAADGWNLKNYFSTLRDRLRQIKASEEELPREVPGEEAMDRPSQKNINRAMPTGYGSDADKMAAPDELVLPQQ